MKKVIKFVKNTKNQDGKEIIYEDPKKLLAFEKDYLDDSLSDVSYDNQDVMNQTMNEPKIQAEISDSSSILNDKSLTSVHRAVLNENVSSLLTLIKTNDIDLTDKLDRTALYFAVMKNNHKIIQVLLDNNANQNISDIDGVTPFLKAVQIGNIDSVLTLLKYNADFKRVDKDSNSCLHYAITGGHIDILAILLNQNIDCNISNVNGEFPLHLSASCGEERMCELLLGRGALVDPPDGRGATPLMCAAQAGHANIVELLLTANADPLITDSQGRTASDYALASGYKEIASRLIISQPKASCCSGQQKSTKQGIVDNRDHEESDTWNDSPISSPSRNVTSKKTKKKIDKKSVKKSSKNEQKYVKTDDDSDLSDDEIKQIPGAKLPTSNNDKLSDRSESDSSQKKNVSNCRKSENNSPQSNVIPPPCKPLRSLEYLQSGSSSQVHLMTLGPVSSRSRHISMGEQDKKKFDTLPHRYSYQGDLNKPSSSSDNPNSKIAPDLLPKLDRSSKNVEDSFSESDSIPIEIEKTKFTTNVHAAAKNDLNENNYIQKQFSLLESYEKNHSRTCQVSQKNYKKHRKNNRKNLDDDIENFLDENNQIDLKFEKYIVIKKSEMGFNQSEISVSSSKKSQSLPRNYESNIGHQYESNSLPRTSNGGENFIRDMKRYNSYRPKKSKSDGGSKKHGLIDKIKNIFGKKSENKNQNNEKFLNYDDELSISSESVKNFDRKNLPLASMNFELGHSRKSSSSKSYSEKTVYEKYDEDLRSGKSTPKLNVFCGNCCDYFELKLKEYEVAILNKEEFINLLKSQLEELKNRNIYEIFEKNEISQKFENVKIELDTLRNITKKYEEEVKRLVCEKSKHRKECRCSSALDREVNDKWQKQHEMDNMSTTELLEEENKRLEEIITHLQSELADSNIKLCEAECMLTRAQNDVDEIVANETLKLKQILENENKNHILKLRDENNKLKRELTSIRSGYDKLHNIYNETERAFSESVDEHGSVIDENEYLKDENLKLSTRISQVISQISLVKEIAEKKNKSLKIQLKKINLPQVKSGDYNRKSSIDFSNEIQNISKGAVGDTPKENTGLKSDESRLISITDLVVQIQNLNSENTDMYFKLQQSELEKILALTENENDRLKEKLIESEKYSNELQKTIDELKDENLDGCNKIEEIIEDNDKLRKGMEEMLSKMEFLKDDIISKNQIIKDQDSKIGKFLSDSQKSQQIICELESKLKSLQNDFDKKCCSSLASETQKMEIQKKLIDLEEKFGEIENENADLKKEVEKLLNEKTQLVSAKENIATLQNNFLTCKTSLDKLQISNLELQNSTKTVTEKYLKLESTYDENIEIFQKKIDLLYAENNNLRETIQESQKKCEYLENKIALISLKHDNEILTKDLKCSFLERNDCQLCQEIEQIKKTYQNEMLAFQKEREILLAQIEQNEKLSYVNQENFEMKNAVEILKNILSQHSGAEMDTSKLDKIASEIYEKLSLKSSISKKLISPTKISKIPKKIFTKTINMGSKKPKIQNSKKGSNSMPDLEKIESSNYEIIYEPSNMKIGLRKSSSLDSVQKDPNSNPDFFCVDQNYLKWNKQFDEIQKLRNDIQRVTDKLLDMKNKKSNTSSEINENLSPSDEKSKDDYYRELIGNLQNQVSKLQEKTSQECSKNFDLESELHNIKGNIQIMADMENEILNLRKELDKERMTRMQEIELIKLKKEDELKELKFQLKQEFIERKQKLMTDLTIAQNALHVKNIEELKLKKECEKLSKEVTLNQAVRQQRLENVRQSTSNAGSYPCSVACIAVSPEVSSSLMKKSSSLREVFSAQLDNSVTRHRIKSDPSTSNVSDENESNKYLLK